MALATEIAADTSRAVMEVLRAASPLVEPLSLDPSDDTPFVGSHVTGYDNALKGIIEHFWDGKAGTAPKLDRVPDESINFIGGFDGFVVGNMLEIKRIFELFAQEQRSGHAGRDGKSQPFGLPASVIGILAEDDDAGLGQRRQRQCAQRLGRVDGGAGQAARFQAIDQGLTGR